MAACESGGVDFNPQKNTPLKTSTVLPLITLLLCACATWICSAQTADTDAATLLKGPPAGLECTGGETDVFEPGGKLFLNRPYTAKEVPEALNGFQFIRSNIDGVRAVCRQPGVVYVVTPTHGRNPDSRAEVLLGLGFQKTNLPECLLLGDETNLCSVYQKQMAADEPLVLGQWGVLVVPKKVSPKREQYDSGEPAEVEVLGDYECDTFQPGVRVFMDREHKLLEPPEYLNGQPLVRGPLGGMSFRCTKAGVVTVLTPDPANPKAASLAHLLEERGFKRVDEEVFQLFGKSDIDRVRVYQKRLEPGEEYQMERWAVLLGPKNVTTGQRPLRPPESKSAETTAVPNFSPGPEYADSARMYQGIPGIERAANGRLWATWYGGGVTEDKNNYILLYTSGDDGKSWQRALVLDPDGDGPVRPFDPCLWLDPDGKLWLFWAQEIAGNKGRVSQTFAITTDDPGDETAKWSAPRLISKGVMMNKPTVTVDGRWLLPLATWFADGSSRAVVSNDHGVTFSDLGAAKVPTAKDRNADEHMIVERKDGSLWMLVRTTYGIGESVSTDGGQTWTEVVSSSIPHPVSRFFIRRLASGRLLLVRHNPPNNGKTRSHLTAFLSEDDGRTWKGGLLLDERNGVSYPDGAQASDGSIYVIYDNGRERDKKILMAVFTEADVLGGKFASANSRQRVLVNQATGINPTVPAVPAATVPTNRNPNNDGAALLNGSAAVLQGRGVEEDFFEPGKKLFSDRDYHLKEVPESLRGLKFLRGTIDGVHAICLQSGVVYVVTPSLGRNKDSLEEKLLALGFQKVNLPESSLLGGDPNLCTVFQKQMEANDALDLGKWGVIVMPGGNAK